MGKSSQLCGVVQMGFFLFLGAIILWVWGIDSRGVHSPQRCRYRSVRRPDALNVGQGDIARRKSLELNDANTRRSSQSEFLLYFLP